MFAFSKYLLTFALQHLSYRVNHRIYRIRTNASGVFQSCSFYSVKGECCNLRRGHAFLYLMKFFTNNATLSRKFDASEAKYLATNGNSTKRSTQHFFHSERIQFRRIFTINGNAKTTLFPNCHSQRRHQYYFWHHTKESLFWACRKFLWCLSKTVLQYGIGSLILFYITTYFPALF